MQLAMLTALGVGGATIIGVLIGFILLTSLFKTARLHSKWHLKDLKWQDVYFKFMTFRPSPFDFMDY